VWLFGVYPRLLIRPTSLLVGEVGRTKFGRVGGYCQKELSNPCRYSRTFNWSLNSHFLAAHLHQWLRQHQDEPGQAVEAWNESEVETQAGEPPNLTQPLQTLPQGRFPCNYYRTIPWVGRLFH